MQHLFLLSIEQLLSIPHYFHSLSEWKPHIIHMAIDPPLDTWDNLWQIFLHFLVVLDAAHHRHWPGVLKVVSGCHISLFQVPLPEDGMQFGGSMSLHGNHMTLACFHGPNFRSKSWALFHLEEPNIAFWTEAQKIWEDGNMTHFQLLFFVSSGMIINKSFFFVLYVDFWGMCVYVYGISVFVYGICVFVYAVCACICLWVKACECHSACEVRGQPGV